MYRISMKINIIWNVTHLQSKAMLLLNKIKNILSTFVIYITMFFNYTIWVIHLAWKYKKETFIFF